MTIAAGVLLVLAGLIVGGAGVWFFSRFFDILRRLKALEEEKRQREQIATDARGRMRTHHSYNTQAALMDAISLKIDSIRALEEIRARDETELAILKVIMEGPYAYDPEKQKD
jgi:hypothetical protein